MSRSGKFRRRSANNASYWIAKLRAGPLSDADRRRFESWRAAHPSHHAAVEDLLRERRHAANRARVPQRSDSRQRPSQSHRSRHRQRRFARFSGLWSTNLLRYVAIAAVALLAGLFLTMDERADFETAPGAQASFALADGSVILMNTDTAINLVSSDRRRLELVRGEADIIVAEDAAPMRIVVAEVLLEAPRGRLLLRKDARGIALAVIDGKVQVRPAGDGLATEVAAGDYVMLSDDGSAVLPATAKVEDAAAWQEGLVIFDGTPLDAALADVSRYRRSRLLVLNETYGRRQVLGRYSLSDPDALMARLVQENGAAKLELFGLYTLVY